MHHAFWKKGIEFFFSTNILQKVKRNISNNIFFIKKEFPLTTKTNKNGNFKCDSLTWTISHLLIQYLNVPHH
jgi:hypothetical protein